MGRDLYDKFDIAKKLFDDADAALGYSQASGIPFELAVFTCNGEVRSDIKSFDIVMNLV